MDSGTANVLQTACWHQAGVDTQLRTVCRCKRRRQLRGCGLSRCRGRRCSTSTSAPARPLYATCSGATLLEKYPAFQEHRFCRKYRNPIAACPPPYCRRQGGAPCTICSGAKFRSQRRRLSKFLNCISGMSFCWRRGHRAGSVQAERSGHERRNAKSPSKRNSGRAPKCISCLYAC